MTIHITTGDLFANEHNAQAFAHGVNCVGVMGAGIAKEFRRRWPMMYEYYREPRILAWIEPGDCLPWVQDDRTPLQPVATVFNLATQYNIGPHARYDWLEQALDRMCEIASYSSVTSIAMPAIGCGIGGLAWDRVRSVVEDVCGGWSGDVWLYEPRG